MRCWVAEKQRRQTWLKARIEDGRGELLASAKALFIDPKPGLSIDQKIEAVNGKFDSKEEVDKKQVGDQTYLCYSVTGTFSLVWIELP